MTLENISQLISMKVLDLAGIEIKVPGSGIRLATNCAMGPGTW